MPDNRDIQLSSENAGLLRRWISKNGNLLFAIAASLFLCLLAMVLLSGANLKNPPKQSTPPSNAASGK